MIRQLNRRFQAFTRSISSSSSPDHFIDGITVPRGPAASRASNPCSLRIDRETSPPRWLPTHSVFNQASPLQNFDSFASDRALVEVITALQTAFPSHTSTNYRRAIADFAMSSSSQMIHEHAFLAHSNPPVLSTHDRTGIRRDQVDYHPSYHRLMAFGIESRVPSFALASCCPR